jgi:hypothetical protein
VGEAVSASHVFSNWRKRGRGGELVPTTPDRSSASQGLIWRAWVPLGLEAVSWRRQLEKTSGPTGENVPGPFCWDVFSSWSTRCGPLVFSSCADNWRKRVDQLEETCRGHSAGTCLSRRRLFKPV